MTRPFWRRIAGITETPELELVRRVDGPSGTAIEVVVRYSAALEALAPEWAGYPVTIGAHWLDRKGDVTEWDGPRGSLQINMEWLPTSQQRRWVQLGDAPAGATAASVELIAEGLQWSAQAGLAPIVVILKGTSPTLPAVRPQHHEPAAGQRAPATSELRLAEVITSPDGISVDIEVCWSDPLELFTRESAGAPVVLSARWIDSAGGPSGFSAASSAPISPEWLPFAPQIRRIHLGPGPADGRGVAVDIQCLSQGGGPTNGLDTLILTLGDQTLHSSIGEPMPSRPIPPRDRGHGPCAPSEPPSKTRGWLEAAFPEDAKEEEMRAYVGADLARFLMSVQLMGDAPGDILEIGSNPYFISRLIAARFPESPLSMTNYFGFPGRRITQRVLDAAGNEVASFTSEIVDTETEPLPYGDESFDTALLCEVIEHLIKDPVFQLAEIARVLRPGGRLILTTPNVARRNNRVRLAEREGIYDPYSQYGPHGRHNREYTAAELFELVSGVGLTPVTYLTRPVHSVPDPDEAWFRGDGDDGAGDYHFLVLEKSDFVIDPHRPDWLYR